MRPTIPWIWECQDCGKIHEGLYLDPSWFYWCPSCGGDIICTQYGEEPDLDDPEVYRDYYGRNKAIDEARYKKKKEEEMKMTETGESGA